MNKRELRGKYKELRKGLCPKDIDKFSLEIANKILELPIWKFLNYHTFLSITQQKEIQTEYILHILQGKDKNIIVPKVLVDSPELSNILLQDHTVLKLSNYNVPEPVTGIEIQAKEIDVVFIPLFAYDKKGNRVGYGKGYYDRFLAQCKPETIFIGLSFFEPEEKINCDSTDIPLHYCVTPKKIYCFKK